MLINDKSLFPDKAAILWVSALLVISAFMGAIYAIHNTDSHHWGFILGTALDFSSGRTLFDQVFVQYGAGGPILFKAINVVWPLTYTNIGLIAAAFYAATLGLLFLTAARLTSPLLAALVTTLAVLVHPYAIYPWGDYFAGFSLMMACFLLGFWGKRRWATVAAGLFLFFAFLFRNTYLVNVAVSVLGYLAIASVFPKVRSRSAVLASLVFIAATALYFLLLLGQGKFDLWYAQNFGAATSSYGVDPSGAGMMLVYRILFPEAIWAGVFSVMLGLALFYVVLTCFFRDGDHPLAPLGCFFAVLGATGFAQGAMIYELFRLQNACMPLFLMVAVLIHRFAETGGEQIATVLRWSVFTVCMLLAIRLPAVLAGQPFSSWNPLLAKPFSEKWGAYQRIEGIPILAGHRYQPDVAAYYQSLAKTVCQPGKAIVNLTPDPLIPYLCDARRNQLSIPMYSEDWLRRTSPREFDRVKSGLYRPDELLVADLIHRGGTDYVARFVESGPATGVALKPVLAIPRPQSIPWIGGPGVVVLEVFPVEASK